MNIRINNNGDKTLIITNQNSTSLLLALNSFCTIDFLTTYPTNSAISNPPSGNIILEVK